MSTFRDANIVVCGAKQKKSTEDANTEEGQHIETKWEVFE